MKLFHLSDLHIGKLWHQMPMIEDQRHILGQITDAVLSEHPDAVLIAGDIYDRAVPSEEAVTLFDCFVSRLVASGTRVLVIAGNHDSDERLAFGSRIMASAGCYFAPVYDGTTACVRLEDEYGTVRFHLLPYINRRTVSHHFPDERFESETEAMQAVIRRMEIDPSERNVVLAHPYVTGSLQSDSEEQVGHLDGVSAEVFSPFDYVALGHLHRPQSVDNKPWIRYSGTPLKYSFSETEDRKSITVVELGPRGTEPLIRQISLCPLHEVRDLRGSYDEVMSADFYRDTDYRDAYVRITLTDEDDIPEGERKLRLVYRNMLEMRYDNTRTRNSLAEWPVEQVAQQSPADIFRAFYEQQNGIPLNPEQEEYILRIIDEL